MDLNSNVGPPDTSTDAITSVSRSSECSESSSQAATLSANNNPNGSEKLDSQGQEKEDDASISISGILWELLSLILATVSLIVLIAILRSYDDKPTSAWKFGITLNAILSIVSTIFRGCLLIPVAQGISQFCWVWYVKLRPLRDLCDYDAASRGPLGSVKLLWRLKLKHVASVGAIITLAAVALDPIFQQTVDFCSRPAISSKQEAYVVAAHSWGDDNFAPRTSAARNYPLPYDMQVAISNGLKSGNTLWFPDPPHSCPSGNCTWDPYSTLAISVRCENITDKLNLDCKNEQLQGDACTLRAPDDDMLHKMLEGTKEYHTFSMYCGTLPDFLDSGLLKPYANVTGFLTMCQWAKATDVDLDTYVMRPNSKIEAGRCAFYLSVKEIKSTVKNGVYTEDTLQEYTFSEPTGYTGDINVPTARLRKISSIPKNGTVYQMQQMGSGPPNVYKPPFASAQTKLKNNNTFVVPYYAWLGLASSFNEGWLNEKINLPGWDKTSSPIRRMLYRSDNITRAMYGIAEYATTAMRANATNLLQQKYRNPSLIAPEEAVIGSVWVQAQFVNVRWEWLALPIILLVFATLFLAAAYFESRRLHVGLWQSSPLSLLFHSRLLECDENSQRDDTGSVKGRYTSLNTEDAMQNAAVHMYAKISKEARGTIEVYSKKTDSRSDKTKRKRKLFVV